LFKRHANIFLQIFSKGFHISNLHEMEDILVYGFNSSLRGRTLDRCGRKLRRGWVLARSLEWLKNVPIDDYPRPGNY
jgi:hypothetical protein